MANYYLVATLAAALLVTPALAADDHDLSVADVLNQIIITQNVSKIQDVDCNRVADEQFAILGDAVMEQIHPGAQHEVMDAMMGGEGSESLTAMHIAMGQSYLGCSGYAYGVMGSGMMGSAMMNGMMGGSFYPLAGKSVGNQGFGMMGYGIMGGSSWFGWGSIITTVLLWIVLILLIVALVKWLTLKK